jgi:CRP/FNR family transcriptional regulator, cyclic AMP receptor protein
MRDIIESLINNPLLPEGKAWKRYCLAADSIIVAKGALGNSLFFLDEGKVRVLGVAELSESQVINPGLCDLSSGVIFGDVCLYSPQERTASVVALTQVRIVELDAEFLRNYLDGHPNEGYLFLKSIFLTMTNRLALANHRVEYLLAWGVKQHDIDKFI